MARLEIFVLGIVSFLGAICAETKSHSPPEIYLEGYWGVGLDRSGVKAPNEFRKLPFFRSNLISKNTTDYIVKNVSGVLFICQAPFPVEWTIPDKRQLPLFPSFDIATEAERISEFGSSPHQEPKIKQFRSFLSISRVFNFFSIGFSCGAPNNTGNKSPQQSSIHLYMYPLNIERAIHLESMRREVKINIPLIESSSSIPTFLPCRPVLPEATVTLEKKETKNWKLVSSMDYRFNPKFGFTLPRNKSALGTYRCTLSKPGPLNIERIINVVQISNNHTANNPEPHSILKGKAKIVLKDGHSHVKCCTGTPSVRPKLNFHHCSYGRFGCDMLKHSTSFNEDISQTHDNHYDDPVESDCIRVDEKRLRNSVLICQGDNIDYRGEFSELFRPDAWNITRRKHELDNLPKNSSVLSFSKYTDVGNHKNFKVEEKMLILVGHNGTGHSKNAWILLEGNGNLLSRLHPDRRIKKNEIEHVEEYGRNFYYEGEILRTMCFGLKYFYGAGAYLQLNWKNGTKTILTRRSVHTIRKIFLYGGGPTKMEPFGRSDNVVAEFGDGIKADTQMQSVDCFMPLVNSAGWDKLRYPIKVLSLVPIKHGGQAG